MSRTIDRHRLKREHDAGLDVLGGDSLSVSDFVPWLSLVQKVAGAGASSTPSKGSQEEAIKKALMEAEAKKAAEATAKAEKTTRTILYVVLGVVGAGLATFVGYKLLSGKSTKSLMTGGAQ